MRALLVLIGLGLVTVLVLALFVPSWRRVRKSLVAATVLGLVVLGVAALALLDFTPPHTSLVTDTSGWHQGPFLVAFTSTDNRAGVDHIEYRLAGKPWLRGSSVLLPDGVWTLAYRSVDKQGNTEQPQRCVVRVDSTAPDTEIHFRKWQSTRAHVHFSASDTGSGVARTEFRVGKGPWQAGRELLVPAKGTPVEPGTYKVFFRSIDRVGNYEGARSRTIHIDTERPATYAPRSVQCVEGDPAHVPFVVKDNAPMAIVRIHFRGTVTRTVAAGAIKTNQLSRAYCKLPPGHYSFTVLATDLAGNRARVTGSNSLTVIPLVKWSAARRYVGQYVAVTGRVVGATYASSSNGSPTFLDIGNPYPDPYRFTVVIWGEHRSAFPQAPESAYLMRRVRVIGTVALYNGVPEIEVSSPRSIVRYGLF